MKIIVLDKKSARKFKDMYKGFLDRVEDGDVICLGAIDDKTWPARTAGILLASFVNTTVNLEWLYIRPEYRRKGVATQLLDTMMTYADKGDIEEVFCTFGEKNEGMSRLMIDFGFYVCFSNGWHDYVTKLEDFAPIPKEEGLDYSLGSLFNATPEELAVMNDHLQHSSIKVGVPLPIDPRDYSPLSVCIRKDGEISGILLVEVDRSSYPEQIEFPWVYVRKDCFRAIPAIYGLAIDAIREIYPKDTLVHFETANQNMDKMIGKIAPGAHFSELYLASWQF